MVLKNKRMMNVEQYSCILDPDLRFSKGKAAILFATQRQCSIDLSNSDMANDANVNNNHDSVENSKNEFKSSIDHFQVSFSIIKK